MNNINRATKPEQFLYDNGAIGASFLGEIGKSTNLYDMIDKTSFGKSIIGKEMDAAGRHMFNHRFGGGHLWWQELANRPLNQWNDVLEHLASDVFTPAGIPYLFDADTINNPDLLRYFRSTKSYENWGMLNGFEFIAGGASLIFSIYDATTLSKGYESDIAFATNGLFVALSAFAGVSTSNPLLIVSALVKTSTIIRKNKILKNWSSDSPFDVDTDSLLDLTHSYDVNVEKLLGYTSNFDFSYKRQTFSYNKHLTKELENTSGFIGVV